MKITINEVNKSEFCKDWTQEQKYKFLKCLDVIYNQSHSGTSIMFLRSFLNEVAEGNMYVEHIVSQIEMMKKDYDKYDLDIQIREDILEILKITQDESILKLIDFYITYGVITPITFEDEKWEELNSYGDSENLQHKECSAVFKDIYRNEIYYLDAIYFHDINEDTCFSSNGIMIKDLGKVSSKQYIKGESFLPKTFYLDVKLVDAEKEIYEICDMEVFKEIKEYYDFKVK